jgi:hypothetical protein
MVSQAAYHTHLMRESQLCLERASNSNDSSRQLVAARILNNPNVWQSWEMTHGRMLRRVAILSRTTQQIRAMRWAALGLIHSKALFEYLRERQIRGVVRRRVIDLFHHSRSYTDAMISEHATYLHAAGSYICSNHLGSAVLLDNDFEDALGRYENLYQEYFRTYCDVTIADPDDEMAKSNRALLPLLKFQLNEHRQSIHMYPQTRSTLRRETSIRRPVGDTQKIRTLKQTG